MASKSYEKSLAKIQQDNRDFGQTTRGNWVLPAATRGWKGARGLRWDHSPGWHLDCSLLRPWAENVVTPCLDFGCSISYWLYEQDYLTCIFRNGMCSKLKLSTVFHPPVHSDWFKIGMWAKLHRWESGLGLLLDLLGNKSALFSLKLKLRAFSSGADVNHIATMWRLGTKPALRRTDFSNGEKQIF